MKNINRVIILLFAIMALLLFCVVRGNAAVAGGNIVTNLPLTIASGGGTTNVLTFIPIIEGRGLSFSWPFTFASLANGTNVGCYFQPSIDGVTLVNSQIWPLSLASNLYYASATSTLTNGCLATNWTAAQLYGYSAVCLVWMTNYNSATLTNGNVIWKIPSTPSTP